MQSPRDIKKRIRSVSNISQITKAMEAVSATKMRKSQEFALRARPFAVASLEMMRNLLARTPAGGLPPLFISREVKKSALLVVASDKGLAGAFNSAVLKKAENRLLSHQKNKRAFTLVTVGKKAKDYFERHAYRQAGRGFKPERSFWGYGDYSELEETVAVSDLLINGFLLGDFDEVEAVYTNFKTTLKQEAVMKKILPVTKEGIEEAVSGILPEHGRFALRETSLRGVSGQAAKGPKYFYEYKLEPSPAEILERLVPQLLRMHIHHVILESNASEHSARMVAMKNASENAGTLIDDLSLIYNKARQAGITKELTEITAGADSLEK